MSTLTQRTALITGGARGIGLGIAEAFLRAGARVMLADLGDARSAAAATTSGRDYALASSAELTEAAAGLATLGEVASVAVDVTDREHCIAAVNATLDRFGGVDILVNNAGIVHSGPIADFSEADWDRIFAVNSKGIFLMTQAALPALTSSAAGTIINTASIADKKGYPNMVAYCGSKFAAIGITQALAAELAPRGIRVNAICPGMVGTAMWLEHLMPTNAAPGSAREEEFDKLMAGMIPLGRPQTPADMGAAAVYLAGADNVTGIAVSIAGGFEMN